MANFKELREQLKKSKEMAEKPIPNEPLTGIIKDISELTAEEVYGESAKDPDREVLNVTVEVTQTGDRFRTAFTKPQGRASWNNPAFKLRQFVDKYGDVPDIDMKVEVEVSTSGHFNIVLF